VEIKDINRGRGGESSKTALQIGTTAVSFGGQGPISTQVRGEVRDRASPREGSCNCLRKETSKELGGKSRVENSRQKPRVKSLGRKEERGIEKKKQRKRDS